eukprot:6186734-Pleurochrysis_carterae.AAC.1
MQNAAAAAKLRKAHCWAWAWASTWASACARGRACCRAATPRAPRSPPAPSFQATSKTGQNKTKQLKPDGASDTSLTNSRSKVSLSVPPCYCHAVDPTSDTGHCRLWCWRLGQLRATAAGIIMQHPPGTDGAGRFCLVQ